MKQCVYREAAVNTLSFNSSNNNLYNVIDGCSSVPLAPAKHISGLYTKWEQAMRDKDGVESTIKMLESTHKAELATQLAQVREEMAGKIAEAREKERNEGNGFGWNIFL